MPSYGRAIASKDDYAKANKVLEVWMAEGAEV